MLLAALLVSLAEVAVNPPLSERATETRPDRAQPAAYELATCLSTLAMPTDIERSRDHRGQGAGS